MPLAYEFVDQAPVGSAEVLPSDPDWKTLDQAARQEYFAECERENPTPLTPFGALQARIRDIQIDAGRIAVEMADKRQQVMSMDAYPGIIAEIRKQIITLTEVAETILVPWETQIMAIKMQVAEAIDEKTGKAVFSNEDKRKAEIERRISLLVGYQNDIEEKKAIEGAVKRLEIELKFLQDQFQIAKLFAELKIVNGHAANGSDLDSNKTKGEDKG